MYTIFSQSKSAVIATVAAASLLAAGPALAEKEKPGKPGMNDIATIAAAPIKLLASLTASAEPLPPT